MKKTLLELLKAVLNASILLFAICLFLGWKLFTSAESVVDQLGEISNDFAPVHLEIQTMTQELAALTTALERQNIPDSTEMRLRLARLEQQFTDLKLETQALKQLSAQAMTRAAEAAAAKLADGFAQWLPQLADCRYDKTAFLE